MAHNCRKQYPFDIDAPANVPQVFTGISTITHTLARSHQRQRPLGVSAGEERSYARPPCRDDQQFHPMLHESQHDQMRQTVQILLVLWSTQVNGL